MPKIKCTTGNSNISAGSTELKLGMVRRDNIFIVRELQHSFPGVIDRVTGRFSASTQGSKASSVLGDWVNRDIELPDGSVFFIQFTVKSKSMPLKKTLTFAFEASEEHPMVQLIFPVVTSEHSTVLECPVVGRFKLLTIEDIFKLDLLGEGASSMMEHAARRTIEHVGDELLIEHWRYLSSIKNQDGDNFLEVRGNNPHESYYIKCKSLLPAQKGAKAKTPKKTVKTKTGGRAIVTSKRRKIRLQ